MRAGAEDMPVLVWDKTTATFISTYKLNTCAAAKAGGFRDKPFLKPPGYRDHLERENMEYEKGNSALEEKLASKNNACLCPYIDHGKNRAMVNGSYQPAL